MAHQQTLLSGYDRIQHFFMKKIYLIVIAFTLANISSGQAVFIEHAKIEFERKVNVWANITGDFAEQFRKSVPQFKTDYFDFEFDGTKALYQPGRSAGVQKTGFFGSAPASENVVYSDYKEGRYTARKNVFEKTYLISDSLRQATWKITNDFREIAGFKCRRATTVIMDSVFVVAFYTDEIMVPGGPESFGGLPGMILGLVINRVHCTWYATRVDLTKTDSSKLIPPVKGTPISSEALTRTLRSTFTNWGKEADRNIWWISL